MNIILSPHLDDAVLSLGGHILHWLSQDTPVLAISVFTLSEYVADGPRGLHATPRRKSEEARVVEALNARFPKTPYQVKFLDFKEAPLRGPYHKTPEYPYAHGIQWERDARMIEELEKTLQACLLDHGKANWFFPLAIGEHADHEILHYAATRLADKLSDGLVFYEDVPYADRHDIKKRLACSPQLEPKILRPINLETKIELARLYESQPIETWIDRIEKIAIDRGRGTPAERIWALSSQAS